MRGKVQLGMSNYTVGTSIRVTDLNARYSSDQSTVITHFRAKGEGSQKSAAGVTQPILTRWELTWKKNGDRWKIVQIQRLVPHDRREKGAAKRGVTLRLTAAIGTSPRGGRSYRCWSRC